MNLNTLRELLTEEITKLKQTQPGRQFSVSAKDGAVINKSYVRRFAIRNKLEKYMFQKFYFYRTQKYYQGTTRYTTTSTTTSSTIRVHQGKYGTRPCRVFKPSGTIRL